MPPCLCWLRVGGATRAMPGRNRTHLKHWPTIGLVACLALLQSGCQSGPFSNCGTGRRQSPQPVRLLRPYFKSWPSTGATVKGRCAAPGVVSDGAVEYGSSSSVITPGATAGTSSYPSGVGIEFVARPRLSSASGRGAVELEPARSEDQVKRRAATQRQRPVGRTAG